MLAMILILQIKSFTFTINPKSRLEESGDGTCETENSGKSWSVEVESTTRGSRRSGGGSAT